MLPSRVNHGDVVDEDLGGLRCHSPQNKRTPRRLIELEPLPIAPRVGHDWEADRACSHNKNVESFVEDTRLETVTVSSHSSQPKMLTRHSPKKVYPRLRTIAQLAENHVHALHNGEYVGRSAARWKDFANRDGQVESSNVSATDRLSERTSEDAQRAVCIARQSSSVVIQTCWRRFAAISLRRRLVDAIWTRQIIVAAWISKRLDIYQRHLQALEDHEHLSVVFSSESHSLSLQGAYYQFPATLLTVWICFMCAKASGHFLRRSPIVLKTIDIPVWKTCIAMARCWRKISTLAALSIQCCMRAFLARKLFKKIHGEFMRRQATLRLQCFFRVCLAQKAAMQLRRRLAAITIQCCWRCYQSHDQVKRQRVRFVARNVCVGVVHEALLRATQLIVECAATLIQRVYRGQKARSHCRWLISIKEQKNWLKNPSKGYILFTQRRYDHAALCLEYCFRQGFYNDGLDTIAQEEVAQDQWRDSASSLARGSRMSFSFSSAPTKLSPDWGPYFSSTVITEDTEFIKYLKFWLMYALSLFEVYEATGTESSLVRSRAGWETCLQLCDSHSSESKIFQHLRFQAQYYLVRCMFWSGKAGDKREALARSLHLLQQINSESPASSKLEQSQQQRERDAHVQLLMISAMLFFELSEYSQCCQQLETLLTLLPHPRFSALEVRFLLALLLYKEANRTKLVKSRTQPNDVDSRPNGKKSTDIKSETMLKAEAHLKRCYQIIELWPSVGYYHGCLKSEQAKQILASAPVGAYLIHQGAENIVADDNLTSNVKAQAQSLFSESSAQTMVLKVKLHDRISSLRVRVDENGLYYTKKIPTCRHFSLHQFIEGLPVAAGINVQHGVKKELYVCTLEKMLDRFGVVSEKTARRHKMLSWSDWESRIKEIRSFKTARPRRNETWSIVCLEVAKALESSQSWVFSAFVANEVAVCSRDCQLRANANFLLARTSFHMQERATSQYFIQRARLEMGSESSRRNNLRAVERALSRNASMSKQESFESQLERLQKLERMCLKAWRYDSLAVSMRADPYSEALLLQRIHAEMYSECADTYFLRSLLKAHVRSFLMNGSYFENTHLQCAHQSVVQLFELFRAYYGNDGHSFKNQMQALSLLLNPTGLHRCKESILCGASVVHLLLIWHHMPFLVCFEISEAFYRSPASEFGVDRVIDMYESLYGRLRGTKPRTSAYFAYEELLLVRLSFLYAQKALDQSAVRYLRSSVKLIDELLSLRRRRNNAYLQSKKPKAIKWPCSLSFPFKLSDAELVFVRGFLLEMLEDFKQIPIEKRKSWKDYNVLHMEVMGIASQRMPDTKGKREPRGIRVFVGQTQDVVIQSMLHSKPFVSVQCEGKTMYSQTAPTWMSLSPSWEEYMEFYVESSKARLVVSLMDRAKRTSYIDGNQLLGSVQLHMDELCKNPEVYAAGRFFDLAAPALDRHTDFNLPHKCPKIFLSVQVIFKAPTATRQTKRTAKQMRGNWELGELQSQLHGDLETFIHSRWIWSRFGKLWFEEQDYSVASWFYNKAVAVAQRNNTSWREHELLHHVHDLMALATCYKATMSNEHWVYYALPLIESAGTVIQNAIHAGVIDAYNPAIRKLLNSIESSKIDVTSPELSGPFANALARNTPASSEWAKIRGHSGSSVPESEFFCNLDTGEYFVPMNGATEPLEYEDEDLLKRCHYEATGQKPHRIVTWTTEMKMRVQYFRQDTLERKSQDPYQWVAVFNKRRQEMQFFSEKVAREQVATDCTRKAVFSYRKQPKTYAMVADEYMLYHVLLVQDAYRKYHTRRQRGRRLRGLVKCACWFARELLAARRRILFRAELKRKQALNCLYVVVERAHNLRAGDMFTSDPFVMVTILDGDENEVAKGKTSVRHNTVNPKWNEEFAFRYDWQAFGGSSMSEDDGDDCDDSNIWTIDESNKQQRSCGRLLFEIRDYDLISLTKRGGESADGFGNEESDEEGNESSKSKRIKDDDLGQASVPIVSLEQGNLFEMDLILRHEMENGALELAQGTLKMSAQWIHSSEFDKRDDELEKRPSGKLLVEATKRPLPKPALSQELEYAFRVICALLETITETLLDLATTAVDPLQRLHKRMLNAQAAGKTAEEAKVVEQRMVALVNTQLFPKVARLDEQLLKCCASIRPFQDSITGMVQDYVDSQEFHKAQELTESIRSTSEAFTAEASVVKALARQGMDCSKDLRNLSSCFDTLFRRRRAVNAWILNIGELMETFIVADKPWTVASKLQVKVDEIYFKMEAQMDRGEAAPAVSSPSNDALNARKVEPTASLARPQTAASAVHSQPKAVRPAEKRMERIQKEKRKQQRRRD